LREEIVFAYTDRSVSISNSELQRVAILAYGIGSYAVGFTSLLLVILAWLF